MKHIVSLLFITFTIVTYTQNSLTGHITNETNEALFGVEIYAPKLHKGTVTNQDGYYEFKNLPNGTIEIVIAFIGYQSVSKRITFNNEDQRLDLSLKEAVFEMNEIIISTPFNKLQSENVMKVERKTFEQLQKEAAPTLMESLASIAGVSQVSTGTNIGKPVIRGLSGNRVLVYTQGVRYENQQYGDEHGLGINEAGIESVEVIKGPASLLYGSDALGGVLYLNPERFATQNSVASNVSSKYFFNTLGSNTSYGFKASGEHMKFLARGSYNAHKDYKVPEGQRVTNTRFQEYDVKTGVAYEASKFSSELRYSYNLSRIGIPEAIEAQRTYAVPENPFQRVANTIISAHNHFYFKNSSLDLDVGYLVNNRKEFEEHHEGEHEDETEEAHAEELEGSLEPALDMKLKTFTYDVKYHLPKFKSFESIIGVQGIVQTNKNFGEELLIPDAHVTDVGLFATIAYQWDEHYLQGGIRFDNRSLRTERHLIEEHHEDEGEEVHEEHIRIFEPIDRSFSSFTASLGYKTELFNTVVTRINLATGYRAPNLAELTSNGVHHGTNRFEIGNAALTNEQNYQIDLALEYGNDHIELFLNGFYNHINNYIFINPTGETEDEAPVFEYTQEHAALYGGEAGFHLHPHPLDWLHFESSFEMVIGKQDNGNYLPLIPANSINNTLRTEFTHKKWLKNGYASVKLQTVFDQDKVSDFETKTKGYNLLHFGLGGLVSIDKTNFNISLHINNLLDTTYISHLSRLKANGIPNMGRNMVLGLQFDI